MDLIDLLKTLATIFSGLATWLGYKKFKSMMSIYRETAGTRLADPFVSLRYRWSGEQPTPLTHVIILHVGNRDRRPIIVKEILWFTPSNRTTWPAEPIDTLVGVKLAVGDGVEFRFDPSNVLENFVGTKLFKGWARRVVMLCELRLVVLLQSGERCTLRAPAALRKHLAAKNNLSAVARCLVGGHAFIYP